jgi:hypothetical protein
LKSLIVKVWKDAVGSKIISTAILAAISGIAYYVSNFDFSKLDDLVHKQTTIPLWSLVALGAFCFFITFIPKIIMRQVQVGLSDGDIKIQLSNWWPEKVVDDGNVFINFEEVDKHLRLPKGSAKRLIVEVAREKYYKPHAVAEKRAEFTVDYFKMFDV